MGRHGGLLSVIALCGALGGAPARGQSPATLTLDDAIRMGLIRNPVLAAGRADAQVSEADLGAARAARWPRLLSEAGWHRTDNPVAVFGDKLTSARFTPGDFAIDSLNHPGSADHAVAALGIEAPLFASGRIRAGIEAASEGSLAAKARVREAEANLVVQITEAYWDLALAGAARQVAESALASASGHERVAQARFENGAALKSDFLRAQVHRLARQRDRERAGAEVELVRARLRSLIGLANSEPLEIAPADQTTPETLGDLKEWIGKAAAGRPEIEAARRAGLAAQADSRAARAALGPELAGTARYERNAAGLSAGEGSYYVGVSIRWSAFDRGRAARIGAAQARADAAIAWTRAAEDRAGLEVEQAYRDAGVADRDLATSRQAVEAAEEARRISAERYASGLLPLTDLLDAETGLVEARMAEISARHDAILGRVRLQRAAGRLVVPR